MRLRELPTGAGTRSERRRVTETSERLTVPRVKELIGYCENRSAAWLNAGQVHGQLVTDDRQHCETTAKIYADLVIGLRSIIRRHREW